MSKKKVLSKELAENRKARYNYEIGETLECGVVLVGSEVKSLRNSGGLIAESYASIEEGELWLINCYIPLHSNSKISIQLYSSLNNLKEDLTFFCMMITLVRTSSMLMFWAEWNSHVKWQVPN